jgi:tetratricopeptide (TPR) repeat protein
MSTRFKFKWPEREEVAAKFHRLPSLEKLALVFLYDRRFFCIVVALAFLFAALVLMVLPLWPVGSAGMPPVDWCRPLDLLQARILRRNAEAAIAAGHTRDGLATWRAAVGNNRGDVELIRGFLRQLTAHGEPHYHTGTAILNCQWLLHLTRTNEQDLLLVTTLCERFRLDDLTVHLLAPDEDKLSPELEAVFAKALFINREPSRFIALWSRLEKHGQLASEPELVLTRQAYLAGWTDGTSASAGQAALDQAKRNDKLQVLAYRLQLVVSGHRRDLKPYADALEFVQQRRATRLSDHLLHWNMLKAAGQTNTVIEAIRSNVCEPRSADESVILAQTCYELGLAEEARERLRHFAQRFYAADHVWLSFGNLLAKQERWDDLYETAMQLRAATSPARTELLALSHYFEGLAELNRNRKEAASLAFKKVPEAPCDNRLILVKLADGLDKAGYPQYAQERLLNGRKLGENDVEYWRLLSRIAYELRDISLLTYAAGTVHRLDPDDPAAEQNYAAALLTSRSFPEEAIALTLESLRRRPNSPAMILNHAAALVQNHRVPEAKKLLRTFASQASAAAALYDTNSLNLIWFDIHLQEEDLPAALTTEKKIDRASLFPPETAWLESALKRIPSAPKRPGAASTNAPKI